MPDFSVVTVPFPVCEWIVFAKSLDVVVVVVVVAFLS